MLQTLQTYSRINKRIAEKGRGQKTVKGHFLQTGDDLV